MERPEEEKPVEREREGWGVLRGPWVSKEAPRTGCVQQMLDEWGSISFSSPAAPSASGGQELVGKGKD